MSNSGTPNATDMMAEAAQHPTYDELLARDPRTVTREDRRGMIEAERADRAAWLAKEGKKAARKQEREEEKKAA